MKSCSPVIPNLEAEEILLGGKDQPERMSLPIVIVDNADGRFIVSRWRFSFRERLRILFGENLWLWVGASKSHWVMPSVALDIKPPQLFYKEDATTTESRARFI